MPFPPGGFSFTSSSGGPGGGRSGFNPSDPNDLFERLFSGGAFGGASGGGDPFSGMGGMPRGGGGGSGGGGRFPGMDMDPPASARANAAPPAPTEIIKPIALTLEELYKGCMKKLLITKKRRNGESDANTLEIVVKPGYVRLYSFSFLYFLLSICSDADMNYQCNRKQERR